MQALLVEQRGIEPLASALRTRRSAKLSYCPTPYAIIQFRFSGFKFQVPSSPQITRITQNRNAGRTILCWRQLWLTPECGQGGPRSRHHVESFSDHCGGADSEARARSIASDNPST